MKFPSSATLRKLKHGIPLVALAGFLAMSSAAGAQPLAIPNEYGKVIYQRQGNPDNEIYIIGQSHRSAQTGANGSNTAAVQAEIYRIGEWLVKNENVHLLLPEGYFCRRGRQEAMARQTGFHPKENFTPHSLDDATLEAALNDTSVFVSADKLLQESYHLKLQQVEDKKLYFSVLNILFRSGKGDLDAADIRLLDYLQEERSAAMLQAIPGAISRELQQDGGGSRKAIFTIGMAHVGEIIHFLKEGEVAIDSPLPGKDEAPEKLKLLKQNYTVTVILPKILAEDQEAVRIANLDQPSPPPSSP